MPATGTHLHVVLVIIDTLNKLSSGYVFPRAMPVLEKLAVHALLWLNPYLYRVEFIRSGKFVWQYPLARNAQSTIVSLFTRYFCLQIIASSFVFVELARLPSMRATSVALLEFAAFASFVNSACSVLFHPSRSLFHVLL